MPPRGSYPNGNSTNGSSGRPAKLHTLPLASRTNKRDHGEVAAALEDLKEQTSDISDKVDGHLMWHLNDPNVAVSDNKPPVGEGPA